MRQQTGTCGPKSYESDLSDVVALQSDVARAIATEIEIKLTPQELTSLANSRPVKPDAYEAYLRGRYYWNKFTEEGFNKGIEYFQRAIEKDPGYAPCTRRQIPVYATMRWQRRG